MKSLSSSGSMVALGDFRFAPPLPIVYYFTCMFVSPTLACGNSAAAHLLSQGGREVKLSPTPHTIVLRVE